MMIDARGQSEPIPAIMTQSALSDGPERLDVLVDNLYAVEYVSRLARREGYETTVDTYAADEFMLRLRKLRILGNR